ncbi:MAG: OmpP1/FadL family transporter [Vicinamibacterales bacterium]
MRGQGVGRVVLLVGFCLSGSDVAVAQTTAQFPVTFDFTTPGARSLAMGGAFVGAADDATAAFTNPAGLAFYGKLEVSVEGRFGSLETPFLSGGRVSGSITGRGLDTVPAPIYSRDTDQRVGLAFVSVMMPVGARMTVTGYRHELARVDNSFFTQGAFLRDTFFGVTDDANREVPIGGRRQVAITNYGGTIGIRLNESFAIGGGLAISRFRLDSQFARYGLVSDLFSPPDRRLVGATAVQSSKDFAASVNAGVLWKPTTSIHLGATFRSGARFDFTQHDQVFDTGFDLSRSGHFKVPNVWGGGMFWSPLVSGRLRVLLDYSRVHYSQLKDDFVTFQALASGRAQQLRIKNGGELRGGAEYQIGNTRIVLPRVGLWLDPDHTITYVPTAAHDATDTFYRATLPGGERLVHVTFGLGVVWSELFEFHVGSDLSSRSKLLTASVIRRFRRAAKTP